MKGITIDDTLMKPSEKEVVADLIIAAHADALRNAETLLQETMKSVAGGSARQGSLHGLPRKRDGGDGSRYRGQAHLVCLASVDYGVARATDLDGRAVAPRSLFVAHAHRRRWPGDRAPDLPARAPPWPWPSLGAARGALSHQEARSTHGASRRRHTD